MEQRSQILKQMHLTKNEREREVRFPWLGSQSIKLLPALCLHRFGLALLAIGTVTFTESITHHPYSSWHRAPQQWDYIPQLHLPSLPARSQRGCDVDDKYSPLCVTSGVQGRTVDPKYVWMIDGVPV